MRRSRIPGALALAILVGLADVARADEQARIAPSWEEGFAEAVRRNVPVVVLLQSDADNVFVRLLSLPALANVLNDQAILLVGHRGGDHEPAKRVDKKTKTEVAYCPIYPQYTCDQHRDVYDNHAGGFDYTKLPAGFICRPDGTTLTDKLESLGAPQIAQKIQDAQVGLGEGVNRSEIDRLERKLAKGDEKLADQKLAAARRIYDDEAGSAKKPLLKEMVERRLQGLDAKALEMIDAAKALEGKARSDQLHKIEREMRGRAPGERAKAVMTELGITGE